MADLLNQIIPDVVLRSDQLWRAFWETIQMVSISGAISLLLGVPFGVLLFTTKPIVGRGYMYPVWPFDKEALSRLLIRKPINRDNS